MATALSSLIAVRQKTEFWVASALTTVRSIMLNKNQIVTLDVTDINNFGCGVGRVDGMVVFVKGAVSGDRVEAKIIKVNSSYLVGKAEKIIATLRILMSLK